MLQLRQSRSTLFWVAVWAVLPLLTACGDGGDDDFRVTCDGHPCTSGSGSTDTGVRYTMYQCEIYYVDGSGWQECGYNGTPGFSPRVPGFIDLDACDDMINDLKYHVREIYDSSLEDQWRGYATLLWCQ